MPTTGQISHIPHNPMQSSLSACLLLPSRIFAMCTKTNGEASMSETSCAFVGLSADVVAAYVSNNSVPQAELPSLIASVHTALRDAANGTKEPQMVALDYSKARSELAKAIGLGQTRMGKKAGKKRAP